MAERMTKPEAATLADSHAASLATIENNRAALYRWFARLFFTPPGEPEVRDLRAGPMRAILKSLAATLAAEAPVMTICQAIDDGSVASAVTSMGIAHTRLFDGAGGQQTASPYRSVYTSEAGLLCQKATAEMEEVLRKYHLNLDKNICEPADHLSFQLEIMSQLALRTAAAMEAAGGAAGFLLAEQADFIDKQLLDWVPHFAERLATVDKLGFHAGLAAVLVVILQQDKAYLAEMIDS